MFTKGQLSTDTKETISFPPTYTTIDGRSSPSYPISNVNVQSFVPISELQAHLRIMGSFAKLKSDVLALNNEAPDSTRAWVVYVNRAVHRFNVFMGTEWKNGFPGWKEETTPPLDVLMVLHAFLLNPRAFHEDSIRRTTYFARNLKAVDSLPVQLIASLIDPVSFDAYPPTSEREAFFSFVGESFVCPLVTDKDDYLSLNCPCCDMRVNSIPWVTDDETGFAQSGFLFGCPNCKKQFTKPMLGIRRFADEVTRRRANRRVYFSEMQLNTETGLPQDSVADMATIRLFRRIKKLYSLKGPVEQDKIAEEALKLADGLEWSPLVLAEHLQFAVRPDMKFDSEDILARVQRMISAYSNAGPASIDLVGAVLRQSLFTNKMIELGWITPDLLNHPDSPPQFVRAIARYHAFLDLLSQSNSFYVPTLDIDLVWHTHQLTGTKYRADTLHAVKRIPSHDDTIDQVVLECGYDDAARAWKARFGVPYSLCGCIPDAPPVKVKEKGKMFMKKMMGAMQGGNPSEPLQASRRPTDYPDLISTATPIDAAPTHPSDHNMHRDDPSDLAVQTAIVRRELMSKERASKILAGDPEQTVDKWKKLQAERKQHAGSHREAFTGPDDTAVFPDWVARVPKGFYGASKYVNTEPAEPQHTEGPLPLILL